MTSMGSGSRKRSHDRQKQNSFRRINTDPLRDAEFLGQNAENGRGSAEMHRTQDASTQIGVEDKREISEEMRISAELAREISEQERSTAEQERSSAEFTRQEAEKFRVAAEEARKAAEELRMITENARQTAEMLREAYAEQKEVFKEMHKTTAEFDLAASAYRRLTEQLKQEQTTRRQKE